jgi:flavorubredoxin
MALPESIVYIGVDDHDIDLFEGQFPVPNGMSYNSYAILADKVAIMDGVDVHFADEWLANIERTLGGKAPDYLIVQHMEPDHSGAIGAFLRTYPDTTVVASAKAFAVLDKYFGSDVAHERLTIANGDTLDLGSCQLSFVAAPMVHWPEVMMTYDATDKVLFTADAFGKFGARDVEDDWACEARRYYFGIVGKFGKQVTALLNKVGGLDFQTICPLHGPVLDHDLNRYLRLYKVWASYEPEDAGITVAYSTVYGHTRAVVEALVSKLRDRGQKVYVFDLARDDQTEALESAFRYDRIVLATTTYYGGMFPAMERFMASLKEHNYQNRTVALIENGSWAPNAAKAMSAQLEGMKDLTVAEPVVSIKGQMTAEDETSLDTLADALAK